MTRRDYGTGTMRERRPGVWQLRAAIGTDPLTGRPHQISRTFRGTETGARRQLGRLVVEVRDNKFDRTRATVGQLLDRWLETATLKPSTRRGYESQIEAGIRPALGAIPLAKLTPDVLDDLYHRWLHEEISPGRSRSPTTVRLRHRILSAALVQAVKWGWIERNPAERSSPPSVSRTQMTVPSPDLLRVLIADAEQRDPVLATAILLAALTGCRRGELCALRWSDVAEGRLTVARSLATIRGVRHETDTKTHQTRVIALDEVAQAVLDRRRRAQIAITDKAEVELHSDAYVLSYRADGAEPIHPDTLTGGFRRCCVRVGVCHHFHELRHFAATTAIAAGMDVRTVAGRLGHADASVTLSVYAHVLEAQDQAVAAVLGRALMPAAL